MTVDNIGALLITLAVSSTGAAVVAGWWNRRKLGADATRIITDAAAGVVKNYVADNDDLRDRVARLERQQKADRQVQILHAAWDFAAVQHMRQHDVNLPEPPPLYAPEVS